MSINALGAMIEYLPIVDLFTKQMKNNLLEGLQELKNIGVVDYGKRIIQKNGYSTMLTTSKTWMDAFNTNQIHESMIRHMSEEVFNVRKNNLNLVTRSPDKQSNEYLKALNFLGLNNSLVKYRFYKEHIEITYFVAPQEDSLARDIFLNKVSLLEKAEMKMLPALIGINTSKNFNKQQDIVINPDIMSTIVGKTNIPTHNVEIDESFIVSLNYRELVYLSYLRFECSNSFLARKLEISESTVKQGLCDLKLKLNVKNREDLISIANLPRIIELSKTMKII